MKKFLCLFFVLVLSLALFACDGGKGPDEDPDKDPSNDPSNDDGVLSYSEYMAAEIDAEVTIEAYVQGKQSWWSDKCTVYLQDKDGGYYAYEMACSEEDYDKLTVGTKIRVTGTKAEWAGEVEITNGTFTFVEGADTYVAPVMDVTALIGNTAELKKNQNKFITMKDLTVVAVEHKNPETFDDDIYVTLAKGDTQYKLTVERYLTAPGSETYTAALALDVGDVITIEGFLYWYEGVDVHITKIDNTAFTYEEYMAAEIDAEVTIKAYVQGKQSWWSDKCTLYLQDKDGGYYVYEVACSEEEYNKLTVGTKVRVSGTKAEWSGEIEIMYGTVSVIENADTFIATPFDITSILTDEDAVYQHLNEVVTLTGMTIKSIEYKNGEPGDDIWVTVQNGDFERSLTVERYLTGPDTELYQAFATLEAGDVIDITGFLYWYEGVDVHITAIATTAEQ